MLQRKLAHEHGLGDEEAREGSVVTMVNITDLPKRSESFVWVPEPVEESVVRNWIKKQNVGLTIENWPLMSCTSGADGPDTEQTRGRYICGSSGSLILRGGILSISCADSPTENLVREHAAGDERATGR